MSGEGLIEYLGFLFSAWRRSAQGPTARRFAVTHIH